MDVAQLARNISEGKGYTTDFIRPLSIYLMQSHGGEGSKVLKAADTDLVNPPVGLRPREEQPVLAASARAPDRAFQSSAFLLGGVPGFSTGAPPI